MGRTIVEEYVAEAKVEVGSIIIQMIMENLIVIGGLVFFITSVGYFTVMLWDTLIYGFETEEY